jgi:hypothetical protein
MTRFLTITLLLIFTFPVNASKIKKGFQELERKNYFNAHEYFQKSLKKHKSIASFGLTKLYLTNDWQNLDSAYRLVLQAEINFSGIKVKKKEKLKEKFAFDSLAIQELKQEVSTAIFNQYLKSPSEELFVQFIAANEWSFLIPRAIHLRDSIAYASSEHAKTSQAFADFLSKYPNSYLKENAKYNFDEYQYLEFSRKGKIEDYEAFLKCCASNPHAEDAENRLFELSTIDKSLVSYQNFAKKYPKNRNTEEAWRMVYKLFMKEYSKEKFLEFKEKYPDYPFLNEIEEDLKLLNATFYPFVQNGLYGYFDNEGKTAIAPQYEHLGIFQDGLAVASKNDKYGLINKKNQVVVDFVFDEILEFVDARGIVFKGDSVGLIDRSGREVVPIVNNDIIALGKGLVAIKEKSDSNYYISDINFSPKTSAVFEEIQEFKKGISVVKTKEGFGVLNTNCQWLIPAQYESIRFLNDTLIEYGFAGKKGLRTLKNVQLTEAIYDEFSKFDAFEKQLIAKQGTSIFYLNDQGKMLFETPMEYFPNAFEVALFYKGISVFRKKGKYGLIDATGKEYLKPTFDALGRPLVAIPAIKDQKWGIVDWKGRLILPYEFDNIETIGYFGFIVEKNGLLGFMDQGFRLTIPISFSIIKIFENDYLLVSNGTKYGLYSKKGELIIPLEFDLIKVFDGDCLSLIKENETAYYFLRSKMYLKPSK